MIKFKKNIPPIEVPEGSNLMQALLVAELPVASSCDGEGVCSKCKLVILEGNENLTPENETEVYLKETNNIPNSMRISCQVQVLGSITVDATYW